jgi:hypothetical protein
MLAKGLADVRNWSSASGFVAEGRDSNPVSAIDRTQTC